MNRRTTNDSIRFQVGVCGLGAILVARDATGLCAISLGDDPHALVHALRTDFPGAQSADGDADMTRLLAEAIAFVEAPARGLAQPLALRGTPFQQRVWQALRAIPPGETVSYTELAQRLGLPHGARAVASACASNRIAVAVPCHRVVRADGELGGYRWGLARKQALLQRESRG